jgi:hypothetical protein
LSRSLTVRKTAQAELTGGEQYRALAEEYRRLADLAITAQEHTDLKQVKLGGGDQLRTVRVECRAGLRGSTSRAPTASSPFCGMRKSPMVAC